MPEKDIEGIRRVIETDSDSESVPDHLRQRAYGLQPDGDLVGDKTGGQIFADVVNLDVDEEYVSDWYDTDGFSAIEIFVNSDVESASNGVKIDYTSDANVANPTVEATDTRAYTNDDIDKGYSNYNFATVLDGFRFRYENNGQTTSNTLIVGTLRTEKALDSANYVDTNNIGDTFLRIGTSEAQAGIDIGSPTSLFDDLQTIERRSIIDLSSSFGTSVLRDETFVEGSGSITEDPDPNTGEIELSTGTTPNSEMELRSAEYGRYTPGYSAQQGVGIRIPDVPTEGEILWGYFDDDNGFYWGYDGDQGELFVGREYDGVATRTYFSDFNGQDFEQVYGRPYDPANGYIYQIDFSWYGYGIINFSIVGQTQNGTSSEVPRQTTKTLHSLVVDNTTSLADPNQPISVEIENGDVGDDNRVRIGGRQFSVFGQRPSEKRTSSDTKEDVSIPSGSWGHVMTWQRRGDSGDVNAKLNVRGIDFGTDVSTRLALVINPNVTGTTFTNPDLTNPNEILTERSFDGTFNGLDGGSKVWEGSVQIGGQGNAQGVFNPDVDVLFGQNNQISLLARGVGGSGSGLCTMRIAEDW